MSSINLVSPKNEQLEKEQARLRMVKMLALVIMALVVVIAVLVFVVNLTLPINSIKHDENVTLANISSQHKKLVQYYLVEDRVNNLSNMVANRQKLPNTVDALLAAIPQELSVVSMQVDAKSVSLIVSGDSLVPMNTFIDDITALGGQKNVLKNVVVQQLSLDVKNSRYSISVQADVK
jgi:Tfp pilus assembly protein PilN